MISATSPSKTRVFNWGFPGSPIQIQLQLDVVDALAAELQRGSEHGSETGGILLGRITREGTRVEIIHATPFTRGNSNGEVRYVLPSSDRKRLTDTIAQSKLQPGALSVVGYYRTHLRPNLSLDEDDLTLMRECFPDPSGVVLLIKPSVLGPPIGGFFFRDEGEINSQGSFLEFPFDAEELADSERNALRDQIERESNTGDATVGWPGRLGIWTGIPRSPRTWIFAALLVGALASLYYRRTLVEQIRAHTAIPSSQTKSAVPGKIGLQVEKLGMDFRVSWNRSDAILDNAKIGILTIKDGQAERRVYLDPVQLRTGTAMYSPTGDVLQFRLEILSPTGESADEQVIAIAAPNTFRESITPADTQVPIQPPRSPAVKSTTSPSTGGPIIAQLPELPQRVRVFDAPKNAPPAALPVKETLPGSPPVLERGTPSSGPGIVLTTPGRAIPPPANAPSPTRPTPPLGKDSSPPDQGTQPGQQGTQPGQQPRAENRTFVPPQPLRQVQPVVPANVRAMLTDPVRIEVQVSLDETGRIRGARVQNVSGPMAGFLTMSALDTARRWTFRPARLGNKNVPSEITLRFRFDPATSNRDPSNKQQ